MPVWYADHPVTREPAIRAVLDDLSVTRLAQARDLVLRLILDGIGLRHPDVEEAAAVISRGGTPEQRVELRPRLRRLRDALLYGTPATGLEPGDHGEAVALRALDAVIAALDPDLLTSSLAVAEAAAFPQLPEDGQVRLLILQRAIRRIRHDATATTVQP